jgi:Acyl-CoA dehydrogenase, C-terminal domain
VDLTPDPLVLQLRTALRTALARVPLQSELQGAPVVDGASGPARAVLERMGAADFERPAAAGGLDLGLTAGVLVSAELGRAACGNPYRAGATAADVGGPAGAALAGLEALPVGSGVIATPRPGGWELTGTATVDDPAPGPLLVATRTDSGPVLVAVRPEAPGRGVETRCWPPVVRFEATPVEAAGVVTELDDLPTGALARARLRQAAYLLGIADGALQIAVRYAGSRRQFDTRLRDLPAVAFPLARAVVASRATGAAVYRGAWLIDATSTAAAASDPAGTAPLVALAMAAETARDVVRTCMQTCGVRAMTAELGLHRYLRLAAAESGRYGEPAALWRLAGAARLDLVRRTGAGRCGTEGTEGTAGTGGAGRLTLTAAGSR